MNNYLITFKYKDSYSKGQWREQECSLYGKDAYDAKKQCIELYGLGVDCEYEIISIEKVGE